MLRKVWAALGRLAYYILGPLALPLFLHNTERTRVGLIDAKTNRILLAQSWVGKQDWQLIGGGLHKNEDPTSGAIREVLEETGYQLSEQELKSIGVVQIKERFVSYKAHLFIVKVNEFEFKKQSFELLDMAWHTLDQLPKNSHLETINFVKNQL